ncbi:hypothetical protein [Nitrosomonas sp.]|uniref:hypothetical protein n=1 Tax=Nitrosomonas sp. TaxID=42353 RepID=UPI0037C979BD
MEEAIVISRLCRWAKWKLGSGKHLGFKPQVNFIRLAGEEAICVNCDDDRECAETNDAVEHLPELHKLLIRIEYLSTARTDKERAFVLGISRQSYVSYRSITYNIIGMFFEKNGSQGVAELGQI